MIKEQKKTYNNEKNGSKKQEQNIEEAQVRTNKIHPNTPFRKQQVLKTPQKENTHLKQRSAFESFCEFRHLVEKREEIFAVFREEEKAV